MLTWSKIVPSWFTHGTARRQLSLRLGYGLGHLRWLLRAAAGVSRDHRRPHDGLRQLLRAFFHAGWLHRRRRRAALDRIGLHVDLEEYGLTFARINEQLRDDIDKVLMSSEINVLDIMNRWRNSLSAKKVRTTD